MANFTNNSIKDTYQRILQLSTDGIVENGTGSANLGDVHLSGSMFVTGSMTLSGDVTANSLTVNSLTQSTTIFSSGSTQFGDSLDDTHSFSGSVTVSGSISADTFTGMVSGAAQLASPISGSSTALSSSVASSLTSINAATSSYVSHSASIVDLPGLKIQYSNVYTDFTNLPNATTYHGMFAHVHATGSAYYAHAGNWVQLANSSSFATDIAATDGEVTSLMAFTGSAARRTAISGSITSFSSSVASSISASNAKTSSFLDTTTVTGSVVESGKVNVFTAENFHNAIEYFSSSLYPIHTEFRGHDLRFLSTSQAVTYGELGFDSSSVENSFNNSIQVIGYPAVDQVQILNATGSDGSAVGITINKTEIRNDGHTLVSSSRLFTIEPSNPLPSSPRTGSFAVTGSRLAFYNGNNWIEISGSILS